MIFRFGFFLVCCTSLLISAAENSCNEGWTKCPTRDECFPEACDSNNTKTEESPKCGPGQVYCVSHEACVPVCPNRDDVQHTRTKCTGELIFCFSLGSCVPPNVCEGNESGGKGKKCPLGTKFCLTAGACRPFDQCGPSVGETSCPFGQVYCLRSKKCEKSCYNSVKMLSEEGEGVAVPGSASDEGMPMNGTRTMECRPGMAFCSSSGRCLPEASCEEDPLSGGEWLQPFNVTCLEGMIFCLAKKKCTDYPECQNVSSAMEQNVRRCQPPKVFCLSYGRCVHPSHCSGSELQKSCPSGYIFCMEKGGCSRSSECNTLRSGSIKCKEGTVFCANLGMCSADCSTDYGMYEFTEALCPEIKGEFQYTNCVTSDHCPDNHICCTDSKTLHLQCINPVGETMTNVLRSSCSVLSSGAEDTSTGVECERPEDCMSGSLCCNRVCQTPRGKKSCPLKTFYSSITNRCEKVGSKSIHSCPPKQVFCPAEASCMQHSECEFAEPSEMAWMMPDLIYVEKDGESVETEGIPISTLYEEETSGESEEFEFIVQDVPDDPYAFECRERGRQNLLWKSITPGTELKSSFYIRFIITSSIYEFAVAILNITEKETNINRSISQIIATQSPKLDLKVKNPLLVTVEDEVQLVAFHEIVSVGETNIEDYWSAWEDALDMPSTYLEMGLLDPSKSTTVEFVDILTTPDREIQGYISIEYMEPEDSESKTVLNLEFSKNEGMSWESLSPGTAANFSVKSTERILNVLLKFTPFSNRWGNASFKFTYVDPHLSPEVDREDDSDILTIQVLKINDAPTALMLEDLTQVPVLTPENPEIVITANKLASLFYVDRDEDSLGVAVIYAQVSTYGSWMYSEDQGTSWKEIDDLNVYPLSDAAISSYNKYQGVLSALRPSSALMSKLQKKPEEGVADNERKDLLPNVMPFTKSRSQAIYSIFQINSNASSADKVNLLFLSSSVLIKYKAKTTTSWDIITAINSTRLLITAWDGTDSETKEGAFTFRKEISLSQCKECGGFGSMAFSPTLVIAQWSGCKGETIILDSSTARPDRCGVCGGDGSTCEDCQGVVNGTAMKICGKCVEEGVDDPRDCAGECNNANSVETIDGNEICMLKNDIITVCDNPCVKCIDNSTRTTEREGLDDCGVCDGDNSCQSCDSEKWSGKVTDICGNCLQPTSNEFNRNCEGIGQFHPTVIDFVDIVSPTMDGSANSPTESELSPGTDSVTLTGMAVGDLADRDDGATCDFIKEESTQVISARLVTYNYDTLKIVPSKLEAGVWNVQCTVKKTESQDRVDLISTEKITVVDSSSAEIESVDPTEVDLNIDKEITVTLKNSSDLASSFCFLKYAKGMSGSGSGSSSGFESGSEYSYYELLPSARLPDREKEIVCHLDSSLRPGKADIGIILKASTLNFLIRDELKLSTKAILLKGLIPRVIEARIDSLNILSIQFDVNIDITNECLNNFENAGIFGEGATCKAVLNTIEITLGQNSALEEGTEINFKDPNKIIQKFGDPEGSSGAQGPFVISNSTRMDPDVFEISGPSKVCNGSTVKAALTFKDNLDPSKLQISWNITWQNKNDEKSQREVLLIWNSTRDIQSIFDNEKNAQAVEFPGAMLRPGVVYLIVATLEGSNSLALAPQSFTVESISSEENLLVSIRGRSKIFPQKTYIYTAIIEMCRNEAIPSDVKFMYFWSLDDAENKYDSLYLKHRVLKPWSLKGGENRTISVAVSSSDRSYIGYGTLEIEAMKQGIKAQVFPEGVKTGTANTITLDASQSQSLDNPNTQLLFSWTCRRADGGGCYVIEKQKPKRFENAMSAEDLNKPVLKIPPLLLLEDRYVMRVSVRTRHGDSATAMINLEVVSGYLPYLSVNTDSQMVDTTHQVTIDGQITSHTDAEVIWKSVDDAGFGRIEIPPSMGDSFMVSSVKGNVARFPVPLTIPNTAKWEDGYEKMSGLKRNSNFKLRLSAFTSGQESSYADIIITKKTPPEPGKIQVAPATGEGLMTTFKFSTTEWKDFPIDLPLTATFGYVLDGSEPDPSHSVWFGKSYGDELSCDTSLPSVLNGNTKILPIVEVCDNTKACTFLKGETMITVTPPREITEEKILEIGSMLESKMEDNSLVEGAIREATMALMTLKAIGDHEKLESLMQIIEYHLMKKSQKLKVSLTKNTEAANASLGMLHGSSSLNDVQFLSKEMFDQLESLLSHFMAYIRNEVMPDEDEDDFVYPQSGQSPSPSDPGSDSNSGTDVDIGIEGHRGQSPSPSDPGSDSNSGTDLDVGIEGHRGQSPSPSDPGSDSDTGTDLDVGIEGQGSQNPSSSDTGSNPDTNNVTDADSSSKGINLNVGLGDILDLNVWLGRRRRRKRQTDSSEEVKPMTAEEVFKLLNFTEMQIKNSTNGDKLKYMNRLVQDISTYISSLCLHMKTGDEPSVVYGQNVSIRVVKSRLEGKDVTKFIVADAEGSKEDFLLQSSYLTWGPVLNAYTQWDCGKTDADGNKVDCFGACLATVEFANIYSAPDNSNSNPGNSRGGHIIRAALLNPEKGTEVTIKEEPSNKIAFNISREDDTSKSSNETHLQCFGWTNDKWSEKICSKKTSDTQKSSNYITCECDQTTYVKVFEIRAPQGTTPEPTTESPRNDTENVVSKDGVKPTEAQIEQKENEDKIYISAKFEGNFTEVVGEHNEKEEVAKEWMTEAIAKRINVSSTRMKDINVTEGCVEYEAFIVDDETTLRFNNENSGQEASAVLAQLIAENFVIEGPNGERLTAISPPPSTKEDETFLPILIGGIVGGVILVCFVFVVLGIYYHKKKKQDKVTSLDGNQPPSYRAILFDKSMDGSDPAGLKKRSLNSRGKAPDSAEWVSEDGKDNFIVQRSVKSGSGSHADSGFGNDDDVPDAFYYKTPTKEQLEKTGPIPEHVLRQIKDRNEDIPGTPQDS